MTPPAATRRWTLRAASSALVAGALGAEARAAGVFSTLDAANEPLRADFNRAAGKVRLLFLVDPVCPMCLRGLADIDRDLLSKLPPRARLETFVVHEPVIGGKASHIPGAMGLLNRPAGQYWSADGAFGRIASDAWSLRNGERPVYAWDVWTIHGPEAVWTKGPPPQPALLMHQLPELDRAGVFPHLDSRAFARRVLAMLAAPARAGVR
jgi:hypothetical protein